MAAWLLSLGACGTSEAPPRPRVAVGTAAPSYAAVTLGGDSASLAADRGHVVLLNI